MATTVLLVVDVQNALMWEKPYAGDEVVDNIVQLIECCRKNCIEVVYIQHNEEPGGQLEPHTEAWQIYDKVAPAQGEKVFQKYHNSAFKGTGLKDYLDERKVGRLIVTGMQTDYCIDATCKVAFEHDYELIIPEKTNTTVDNGDLPAEALYRHYNFNIYQGRYGIVEKVEDTLQRLQTSL